MSGRDRSVGWCHVACDNGEEYYLPRQEFDRLSSMVENRVGWYQATDVFGATVLFRLTDVGALQDCTPESIKLADLAEAEDE